MLQLLHVREVVVFVRRYAEEPVYVAQLASEQYEQGAVSLRLDLGSVDALIPHGQRRVACT